MEDWFGNVYIVFVYILLRGWVVLGLYFIVERFETFLVGLLFFSDRIVREREEEGFSGVDSCFCCRGLIGGVS